MVPLLVLAAISVLPPPAMRPDWAGPPSWARAPFFHADARATATVRIIMPARVGVGLGAPRPGMKPRVATLTVPGGPDRLLLIYDFE